MEVPNRFPRDVHSYEVKDVPRADVMYSGMLNLAMYLESRAAAQDPEVASAISLNGL